MDPARIAELLDPYLGPPDARRLTPDALDHISTYINILQRWNARMNLTGMRDEEQIVTRHFGESLFAARHLFPWDKTPEGAPPLSRRSLAGKGGDFDSRKPLSGTTGRNEGSRTSVADVGSGAGFPGIPIKLWSPEIRLTLIESNHKKATFLREVTRALTLTDINIQTTRAESLTGVSFDLVTLRAVERFESILPVAASLLARQGRLALLIGQTQLPRAHSALSSWKWLAPFPIPDSQSRILAVATRPN